MKSRCLKNHLLKIKGFSKSYDTLLMKEAFKTSHPSLIRLDDRAVPLPFINQKVCIYEKQGNSNWPSQRLP